MTSVIPSVNKVSIFLCLFNCRSLKCLLLTFAFFFLACLSFKIDLQFFVKSGSRSLWVKVQWFHSADISPYLGATPPPHFYSIFSQTEDLNFNVGEFMDLCVMVMGSSLPEVTCSVLSSRSFTVLPFKCMPWMNLSGNVGIGWGVR